MPAAAREPTRAASLKMAIVDGLGIFCLQWLRRHAVFVCARCSGAEAWIGEETIIADIRNRLKSWEHTFRKKGAKGESEEPK